MEPVYPAELEQNFHKQSMLPLLSLFGRRAAVPRITSFDLSERKTSYEEEAPGDRGQPRNRSDPGEPVELRNLRRFSIPDNWGPCTLYNDVRVLEGLRRFVQRAGRPAMLRYLTSTNSLNSLASSGDPVLRQIMPRGGDWHRVDAADRDVILDWMRGCVGIFFPVFTITLYNPNSYEVSVPSVRYYVIAASPGEAGAGMFAYSLFPVATYAHTIRVMPGTGPRQAYRPSLPLPSEFGWDEGSLRRDRAGNILVAPPARRTLQNPTPVIPARGHVSFELQIASEEGGLLGDVLMNIELVTSAGSVRTGEFIVELGTGGG
jgi:hypothetical protein